MLRRALFLWGLGHIAIGERRGWLLAIAEVAALGGLVLLAGTFLEGDRSSLVFVALVAFFMAWGAQAVHAYLRAEDLGASPGGAVQVLALAPLAVLVFTFFWSAAGRYGTSAAVLQQYASAWREGRPLVAAALYVSPPDAARLGDRWDADEEYVRERLAFYGQAEVDRDGRGGQDPTDPLQAIEFRLPTEEDPLVDEGTLPTSVSAEVVLVRRTSVRSSFFGLFPIAAQQSVPLERVGVVTLIPVRAVTLLGDVEEWRWRIAEVDIGR